jgi:hypothetical protein
VAAHPDGPLVWATDAIAGVIGLSGAVAVAAVADGRPARLVAVALAAFGLASWLGGYTHRRMFHGAAPRWCWPAIVVTLQCAYATSVASASSRVFAGSSIGTALSVALIAWLAPIAVVAARWPRYRTKPIGDRIWLVAVHQTYIVSFATALGWAASGSVIGATGFAVSGVAMAAHEFLKVRWPVLAGVNYNSVYHAVNVLGAILSRHRGPPALSRGLSLTRAAGARVAARR